MVPPPAGALPVLYRAALGEAQFLQSNSATADKMRVRVAFRSAEVLRDIAGNTQCHADLAETGGISVLLKLAESVG